jgi:signal transduction histidine kinase
MRQRAGNLWKRMRALARGIGGSLRLGAWRARALFTDGSRQRDDPTRSLFHGVRLRMTVWYSSVLVIILLISGVLLYSATRNLLDSPVDTSLTNAAKLQSALWLRTGVAPCGSTLFVGDSIKRAGVPYVACFGPDGIPLGTNLLAQGIVPFANPDLARTAIAQGSAQDTVDGGQGLGTISRYALAVRDPVTGALLGVVQVGVSIEGEVRAEQTLLSVLLIVGGIMVAVAMIGGFWLSSLALEPARLALERQRAFVADASHELRTPLTIVRSSAEVLQRTRDRLDADDADLVDDIVTESAYLSRLAERLLLLAQIDDDSSPLQVELCNLGAIARGVARRMAPLAAARSITIDTAIDEGAIVEGDPALLEEIALILTDNAVKYNRPDGTVTLRVYRDNIDAFLEVADTGLGIDPEHLARLGERFYRVDKARSRSLGGAGLGLAIARGIAAAHHGSLHIESATGEGTTVRLRLPWTVSSAWIADTVDVEPPQDALVKDG